MRLQEGLTLTLNMGVCSFAGGQSGNVGGARERRFHKKKRFVGFLPCRCRRKDLMPVFGTNCVVSENILGALLIEEHKHLDIGEHEASTYINIHYAAI